MASRDLHHIIKPVPALNSQTVAAAAVVGAIIDTQGYESLEFAIQSATITDGTSYTPKLEDGDAALLTDAADVVAADLIGTIANATFAATDDNVVKKLGYKGNKRYVRLTLTPAGATNGGVFSAVAILGHPHNVPAV